MEDNTDLGGRVGNAARVTAKNLLEASLPNSPPTNCNKQMTNNPKPSKMFPRDQGVSMDLIGGTGGIRFMIALPGFMEIYKVDKTFRTQSPDSIDPDRTQKNIPWLWKISDDEGFENPIIGRVFIQCVEALKNKSLIRGNVTDITVALHTCKEDLRNCEKALLRLVNSHDEIIENLKEKGGLKTAKNIVTDFPHIPNLEQDVTIYLTSGRRALQSVAEILNQFYGIQISNARFDKGKKQLQSLEHIPEGQISCLNAYAAKIERLLNLRNNQEHTPKKTIIENFHLRSNKFQSPTWFIDPDPPTEMLPEMRELLVDIVELCECSFFWGLLDDIKHPPENLPFCYVVEEIPEKQRESAAIRYRCELKPR